MRPVEEYQKIVDDLVKKSFLILKGTNVKVFMLRFTKLYAVYVLFIDNMEINSKYNFKKKKVKGILVHELCYVRSSKRGGFWKIPNLFIIYWFNREIRRNEKMRTDKLIIKKEYTKELLLSAKRSEKQCLELRNKSYISFGGIKSDTKKIEKW